MKKSKGIEYPVLFTEEAIAAMQVDVQKAGEKAKQIAQQQAARAQGLTLVTDVRPYTTIPRKGLLHWQKTASPR